MITHNSQATVLIRGSLLNERYFILEKIGEGGFGVVYKARDRKHWRRLVAIKQINMAMLSAEQKIEATDSYNREVLLLSWLRHKNLPRLYDHFTDPEHWYLVEDYLKGQTLEDILEKKSYKPMSVRQVLDIGLKLCDVLSYLHAQEPPVIFRDIKPANIMLTANDLYLIDFGIARRYREGKRHDTIPLGSPGYAAPEQYGKQQTSPRTDIYGLGATLQTLLTGREPLEIKMNGISPDNMLPKALQDLIEHMMAHNLSKRPESIEKVKQSLLSLRYPQQRNRPLARRHATPTNPPISPQYLSGTLELLATIGILALFFVNFFWHSLPSGFFITPWSIAYLLLALGTMISNIIFKRYTLTAMTYIWLILCFFSLLDDNRFDLGTTLLISIVGLFWLFKGLRWYVLRFRQFAPKMRKTVATRPPIQLVIPPAQRIHRHPKTR